MERNSMSLEWFSSEKVLFSPVRCKTQGCTKMSRKTHMYCPQCAYRIKKKGSPPKISPRMKVFPGK